MPADLLNFALLSFGSLITFLVLRTAALYSWVFGEIPLKIMSRLMGLILAAVAVQFMLNGIGAVQSVWNGTAV